jgi:hypothetical protein
MLVQETEGGEFFLHTWYLQVTSNCQVGLLSPGKQVQFSLVQFNKTLSTILRDKKI